MLGPAFKTMGTGHVKDRTNNVIVSVLDRCSGSEIGMTPKNCPRGRVIEIETRVSVDCS